MSSQTSWAQQAALPQIQTDEAETEAMEIIVTGNRTPGAVIGDIEPEVTLSPGDIRSFGVTSVTELVSELAAQIGSGQGRGGEAPVVLLNGGRISGFAEVRDIPTEAIARVEILPEEVALKYGYRATQKVMNIVLRRRFRAVSAELEATLPTEGGQWDGESQNSLFRTGNKGRLNLALDYTRSTALTEAERDIIQQPARLPFAASGNISAIGAGSEIDPALSLLTGSTSTVAGVPATALSGLPTLADFAAGAVNTTDTGALRTLRGRSDAVTANAVYAKPLNGGATMSVNASLAYTENAGLRGLAATSLALPAASIWSPFAGDVLLNRYIAEFGALNDRSRDWSGHLGTTFNGSLKGWNWSLTGNFDHADVRSRNETGFDLTAVQARISALDPLFNPYAALDMTVPTAALVNMSRSTVNSGDAKFVVTGTPFAMPAGKASLTVSLGGKATRLKSQSDRNGIATAASLSRTEGNIQVSLDIPIASRREAILDAIGDLSLNLNAGYDRYSDAGGQRMIGAGLNWSPVKPLSLIASWNKDEGAPTIQQLGNPLIVTPGVRIFDYVNGETVDITRITGGNALLASDDRRVIKLGMTLKPFAKTDLSIVANYTDIRISNPIAGFPAATTAIQAAFPARFTRDATGRLTAVDARPVNYARADQRELRWGINFSKRLSAPRPPAGDRPVRPDRDGTPRNQPSGDVGSSGATPAQGDAAMQEAMRAAGRGPGAGAPEPGGPGGGSFGGPGGPRGPGGFGGRGMGGGMRGTRVQAAIYHTYRIEDKILIAPGIPALDLLNGDATGNAGGVSRHEVRAQAGLTHNGIGIRTSATWRSGTRVDSGVDSLRFSDLATVNLRLFANLGLQRSLVQKVPFLRGARLSISVENLFNARQRVRDSAGQTPLGFQPAYLDPLGRTISISFRKLFF